MSRARSTAPGFLVTFEGVEGGGKSTQAALLQTRLLAEGHPVVLSREPGGVALAESIRAMLLDPQHAGMEPLAELYLILAARSEHVGRVVRPALAQGRLVLIDRFSDATIAYQSGGRGLPRELVAELAGPAAGGLAPDLTFLIDLAPQEGFARRSRGHRERDRLEEEDLSFHERVRGAYLDLARREPARIRVVDGARARDEVHGEIHALLGRRLEEAGWPGRGGA